MSNANNIGRIGGLATALGIGVGLAATPSFSRRADRRISCRRVRTPRASWPSKTGANVRSSSRRRSVPLESRHAFMVLGDAAAG